MTTSFNALPTDVLRLIVDKIALRPRLLVLARVCRRWQNAVYLSVHTIPHPLRYRGPFDRFPNLTDCSFSGTDHVPETWTPEQRARLRSVRFELSTLPALEGARLTSLTSLEAHLDTNALPALSELVRANAASLTHLNLRPRMDSPWWQRCDEKLPPMPDSLPRLRSLVLQFRKTDDGNPLQRFAPVLSQLVDLEIPSEDETERFAIALPKLRNLHLDWLEPVPECVAWLTGMPPLAALSVGTLNDSGRLLQALDALSHLLTSLSDRRGEPCTAEALAGCTRLRSLGVDRYLLSEVRCLWPIAPQVETIMVNISYEAASFNYEDLTSHFTSLTKLHLRSGEPLLSSWRLPYLRDLSCDRGESLDWVTRALRSFPTLEMLSVELSDVPADESAFKEEVRAADRRGMQLIELTNKSNRDFAALRASLQWCALRTSLQWLTLRVPPPSPYRTV